MAGADLCLKRASERANSWILDYAYYCTWEEFCSTKNIDIKTTRDFVQWIVQQPYISTSDRKLKVQIMLLMCRLSDGSDHTTRYVLSSDLTALEESLCNIDLMESSLGKDHADTINALRISIKKQAVLVCCRADDFYAGKKVFQRQWKNMSFSTKDDERIVDHLQTVLESYDKDQSYIKFSTYERFLKTALECLSIINKAFTAPYLLQKAETFGKRSYFDKEKSKSCFSITVMDEWAKTKNMKARTPKAKQKEDLKLKKIRLIKERNEYMASDSSDDAETADNYAKYRSKKRKKMSRETDKNNCNKEDIDDSDGPKTEDSDAVSKKRKIASSTPKKMSRETDKNNCNKEDIDDSDGPKTEDSDAVSKKRKIASSTPKKMSRETDKNNCNKEDIDDSDGPKTEDSDAVSKKRKIASSTPKKMSRETDKNNCNKEDIDDSDGPKTEDSDAVSKKRKIASSTPKKMSRETDKNNCNKEDIDDSDGPKTEDSDAVSKKRKIASSTPKKMSRETDKNNCNKEDIDDSEDEELSPVHRCLPVTKPSPNKNTRKPWSRDETVEFYKAVQKFGEGNWSNIKSHIKTVRTNVQLKDRWRNMTKDKNFMKNLKRKLKSK